MYNIAILTEKDYTFGMLHIFGFTIPASIVNTVLLFILLIVVGIILFFVYKHCKKTDKRLKEIEDTYGYLHFLDNANLRIYKQYLKEKAKNEKKPTKKKK